MFQPEPKWKWNFLQISLLQLVEGAQREESRDQMYLIYKILLMKSPSQSFANWWK